MNENGDVSQSEGDGADLGSIRDLSDFCNNWPQVRRWVSDDALGAASIHANTLTTIRWLVLLADRVCYDFDQ